MALLPSEPVARAVAACAAGAVLLTTACDASSGDPLQVAGALQAATPAASPPAAAPAGHVQPLDANATAVAFDAATGTLAVAVTSPDRLLLYRLAELGAAPRVVDLPGATDQIDASTPGELLVGAGGAVLRVDAASGATRTTPVDGQASAATTVGDDTVVTLPDRLLVLDSGGRVVHTVGGFAGAADVVAAGGRAAVLDRLRTALYSVDAGNGRLGPGLRAGGGATNAVADRFGRVLVTDTRDGELLAFTADPMIMRQRFPVPGAPYAIAYDPRHDLAWVTLTERNEVVGFDVAGGEPVERYRLATVRQPNAVAVDAGSGPHGTVIIASGAGEGIQVVQP
jgi:DNA-binding beta-propeller fold protein YncE